MEHHASEKIEHSLVSCVTPVGDTVGDTIVDSSQFCEYIPDSAALLRREETYIPMAPVKAPSASITAGACIHSTYDLTESTQLKPFRRPGCSVKKCDRETPREIMLEILYTD
eukprot:scaffold59157_cov48-Attheya_sp.AAC.1